MVSAAFLFMVYEGDEFGSDAQKSRGEMNRLRETFRVRVDDSARSSTESRVVAEVETRASGSKTETTVRRSSLARCRSRHPRLCCVRSPDPAIDGLSFELDGTPHEFGRGHRVSTRVQDPGMSRRHFRLEPRENGYEIIDFDTANGTFVDGERLEGSAKFDGEVISVGDTIFVLDGEIDPEHLPFSPMVDVPEIRGLLGTSAAARALRRSIATVSQTDGTVLLLGATGTGKEVSAQAIHEASGREGDFVAVNCAAIPSELAESEFFCYVKGAFTGADQDRPGFFEQADGGTLFLDEVGDLPATLQAKLLRVLEDWKVRRVGDGKTTEVDVRIVAATHMDLENSGFRRDLLARLGDWVLRLPCLSQRKADIPILWSHFFGQDASRHITAEFQEALLLYGWPMNVRELKKLARRVAELAPPGEEVDVHLLPRVIREPLMGRLAGAELESEAPARSSSSPSNGPRSNDANVPPKEALVEALRASRGNVKQAAIDNGWHRTQLYRWLRRSGVDPRSFR